MKKLFQNYPIITNLVLIAGVLAGFVVLAYYVMDFGTRHDARRTVPNFVGLVLDDVKKFADDSDLEIIVNDSLYIPAYQGGVVLDQHPVEGVVVKPGRKVYVTISSINQRKAVVPFVAKRTLRQALHLLETSGFDVEKIQYTRDIAHNYVIAQFVNGQEVVEGSTFQANVGSGVVLRVGIENKEAKVAPPTVPQLIGLSLHDAKKALWNACLNVGEISYEPGIPAVERKNAKVCYQSIKASRGVWYGESVSFRLALDKKPAAEEAKDEKKAAEEKKATEEKKPAEEVKAAAPAKEEVKAEPKPAEAATPKVEAPKAEAPKAEPAPAPAPKAEEKAAPQPQAETKVEAKAEAPTEAAQQ